MIKTVARSIILSIILLVSVIGAVSGTTNGTVSTSGASANNSTANVTVDVATNATTGNVSVQETPVSVQGTTVVKTKVAEDTYPPSETSVPEKPVETQKSPGLGLVTSAIVIISAMYIVRRK